ncbi:MAG: antibiotic biosynthesis monooxygenase [Bacteroidetes bacterium]|nr:antibiotic biosynthesis monooxygenase [Bacteroidota bacterium]
MKNKILLVFLNVYLLNSCNYKNDQQMNNNSFSIINQFEVPPNSESEFIDFFSSHIKLINSQRGIIDCRLFKASNNENVLSFISIVRWKNQEAAINAKVRIDSTNKESGVDIKEFQEKYNIKVVNRSFSEIPVL